MNIEELREYCLSLKGATEDFPFNETTLVFKVSGKMFCVSPLDGPLSVSLKNDPEKNLTLREDYQAVKPAYHFNKKHWNMIAIDGSMPDNLIMDLIDESYDLVVDQLTKKEKELLKNLKRPQ